MEKLKIERLDRVVTLTLNDPEVRNALSGDLIEALIREIQMADADLSIGCIVITGAGSAFCAGGNVKDMRLKRGLFGGSAAEIRRSYLRGIQRVALLMHELEVPCIGAINGPAIGAGCDLALMCDIRIASDSACFAESFMRLGLVSGDGGAWYLPRIVGIGKALEMTLSGDVVSASEALRIGLVSTVIGADQLLAEAGRLANKIADQPTHSVRLTKRLMRRSAEIDLPAALDLAATAQAIIQHTKDHDEAVAAFLEKRRPKFSDK